MRDQITKHLPKKNEEEKININELKNPEKARTKYYRNKNQKKKAERLFGSVCVYKANSFWETRMHTLVRIAQGRFITLLRSLNAFFFLKETTKMKMKNTEQHRERERMKRIQHTYGSVMSLYARKQR